MTFPDVDPTQYRKRSRSPAVLSDPAQGAFTRFRPVVAKVMEHVMRWPIVTQSEKEQIDSEHATAKGSAGTTSFTPPGEVSAVTVRFKERKLRMRKLTGPFWEVGPITLVEEPS